MPSLNRVERVMYLMRYIHQHPNQLHSIDTLAKETDIPYASVRRTVSADFPESFKRSPVLNKAIELSGTMPLHVPIFSLEDSLTGGPSQTPQPSTIPSVAEQPKGPILKKRKAEYFIEPRVVDDKYIWQVPVKALQHAMMNGLSDSNRAEFMKGYNQLQSLMMAAELVISSKPLITASNRIDDITKIPWAALAQAAQIEDRTSGD